MKKLWPKPSNRCALNPSNGGSYANCATLYCNLDRLEKMKAIAA